MSADAASLSRLRQRQEAVLARCLALEARAVLPHADQTDWGRTQPELSSTHARLREELEQRHVRVYRFHLVAHNYYETSLEERRAVLGAASVDQLCKTICLTNVAAPDDAPELDATTPLLSRHLLVVVPYAKRFAPAKLHAAVYDAGKGALSKKRINYRLSDSAEALTGYSHGGVTPVGSTRPIPVVLSHHVAALRFFYIGAGDVLLKLSLPTADFCRAYSPVVLDVTED